MTKCYLQHLCKCYFKYLEYTFFVERDEIDGVENACSLESVQIHLFVTLKGTLIHF